MDVGGVVHSTDIATNVLQIVDACLAQTGLPARHDVHRATRRRLCRRGTAHHGRVVAAAIGGATPIYDQQRPDRAARRRRREEGDGARNLRWRAHPAHGNSPAHQGGIDPAAADQFVY